MGHADVIVLMLKDAAVVRNEGPYALNLSVQQGRLEITQLLLASGVSPNEPIKGGWYPYAEAAKQGDVSSMCLMLDYGVNVSLKNDRVGNLVMALSGRHFDAAVLLMAESAFKRKEYSKVVELYEQVLPLLTATELKRLDISRARAART